MLQLQGSEARAPLHLPPLRTLLPVRPHPGHENVTVLQKSAPILFPLWNLSWFPWASWMAPSIVLCLTYIMSDSLTSPVLSAFESRLYACVSCLNEMFLMAGTMFRLPLGPFGTSCKYPDLRKYPLNLLNTWMNKCRDKWIHMLELRASDCHNHVSHIPRPGGWITVINTPVFIMSLCTSYCYGSLTFYTSFFYLRM